MSQRHNSTVSTRLCISYHNKPYLIKGVQSPSIQLQSQFPRLSQVHPNHPVNSNQIRPNHQSIQTKSAQTISQSKTNPPKPSVNQTSSPKQHTSTQTKSETPSRKSPVRRLRPSRLRQHLIMPETPKAETSQQYRLRPSRLRLHLMPETPKPKRLVSRLRPCRLRQHQPVCPQPSNSQPSKSTSSAV